MLISNQVILQYKKNVFFVTKLAYKSRNTVQDKIRVFKNRIVVGRLA